MSKLLKALIIEDSENDTILLIHELKRAGYSPDHTRVDTGEALRAALMIKNWDVILSDHSMPGFSAADALLIYQQLGLDIPFIIVSGRIGEELAVEMMKAGAHDYVRKDHLNRLTPILTRELQSAQERATRRRAELVTAHLAAIVESCEDAIISQTLDGNVLSWNSGAERIFKFTASEMIGRSISHLVPRGEPDELARIPVLLQNNQQIDRFETVRLRKDGQIIHVSMTVSPIKDLSGCNTALSIVARDISQRKQEESERTRLIQELSDALARVKTLSGLLPMCSSCKKIRNDRGYWEQVEIYIENRSNAEFTHSFCPDCLYRLYPEAARKMASRSTP